MDRYSRAADSVYCIEEEQSCSSVVEVRCVQDDRGGIYGLAQT